MRATLPSVILILIFALLGVTSYDSKQFLEPRLVKVEIIDERGVVRAKMMEQRAPSASRDERDKEDDGGIDDEDSKSNEGSGDSSEHLLSDVANDQPFITPSNVTESSSSNSTISPSPTSSFTSVSVTKSTSFTPVIVTKNESYSAVSIVISTKALNSTVTASSTKPTPVLSPTLTNPTTKSTNVVTSTQVVSSSSVTDVSTSSTVVVLPQVTTESTTTVRTTTERPTAIETTTQPSTNKPTTPRETTVISINETKIPVTTENGTLVNITKPAEDTTKTSTVVAVLAHKDPTEKPRKTLFGFVTIEILIALLAGALFSILLVAFLVFRLKKRNEGSYELSETIALRPKELDEMSSKKEVFV